MTRFKTRKRLKIFIIISLAVMLSVGVLTYKHKKIKYKKPAKLSDKIKMKNMIRMPQHNKNKSTILNWYGNDKKLKSLDEMVQQKIKRDKELEYIRQQEEIKRQKQLQIEEQKKNSIQWFDIRVSFYTISDEECGKTDGITASGKRIQEGYIACPSDIPYGTKIFIDGIGTYEAQDRGGAIQWEDGVMKVDVYIPNASQSYLNRLGVKHKKGYIIK